MPNTISPSLFKKVGLIDDARTTFIDDFSKLPKLNASADLNGTFDDAEVEKMLFANKHWELSGTNAVDTVAATSTGGGMTLTTTTGSADQVLVGAHTDSGVGALATIDWSTDDEVAFYIKLKTSASLDNQKLFAGFKLTSEPDAATDAEQVYFRFANADNSGKWEFITSDNGTDDERDTGVTVAASTTYELYFEVDSDRVARAWIREGNGQWLQVAENMAALGTGHDLLPFFGIETSAAEANAVTVRKVALGKIDND